MVASIWLHNIFLLSYHSVFIWISYLECFTLNPEGSTPAASTSPAPPTSPTTTAGTGPACVEDEVPQKFRVYDKIRGVETWEECRDACNADSQCEYFRWKVSRTFYVFYFKSFLKMKMWKLNLNIFRTTVRRRKEFASWWRWSGSLKTIGSPEKNFVFNPQQNICYWSGIKTHQAIYSHFVE